MKSFNEFIQQISPEWDLYERALELYDEASFGIANHTVKTSSAFKEYQLNAALTLALLERYHRWLSS
jgi:hypothetical protein